MKKQPKQTSCNITRNYIILECFSKRPPVASILWYKVVCRRQYRETHAPPPNKIDWTTCKIYDPLMIQVAGKYCQMIKWWVLSVGYRIHLHITCISWPVKLLCPPRRLWIEPKFQRIRRQNSLVSLHYMQNHGPIAIIISYRHSLGLQRPSECAHILWVYSSLSCQRH